jgi:two-component system CheB/CheR fusion protein
MADAPRNNKNTKKQNTRLKESKPEAPIIVGIGASAGGLEALQEFFQNLPNDPGLAFVVVQHLSPDYKSLMDELLSRHTFLSIHKVVDGMRVEINSIYLIPPRKNMTVFNGKLFLTDQNAQKGLNLPIDIFLQSLARDQGKNAIAIILSGTGSDGTLGIRSIKESGGMVMVQDNKSAKFDGMPRSSISTGLVDYILSPEQMPEELLNYVKHPFIKKTKSIENIVQNEEDAYSKILGIVRDKIDVDFSSYKDNTILRRLEKRITINKVSNIEDYVNILLNSPVESRILYKELLIGVTRFFRDKEAFKAIEEKVIPALFKTHSVKNPIRVWSVGCSTGEEAYSLAILFHEYIDKNDLDIEVKIFATDIDRDAIDIAGAGIYPENIVNDMNRDLITKYFVRTDSGYQVTESIRRMVVFATHNLLKDPPFSKIDFISCRNLFIYLLPEVQTRLLSMFYFSLNTDGYLFLGSSETIGDLTDGFQTVNSKWKIYKYKSGAKYKLQDNFSLSITERKGSQRYAPGHNYKIKEKKAQDSLMERMLNNFMPPTVVVDENYNIVRVINDVSHYIRVQAGIFSQNLLKMVPQVLSGSINSLLRNLQKKEDRLVYSNIKLKNGDESVTVSIEGLKYTDHESERTFYSVSFRDTTKEVHSDQESDSEQRNSDIGEHYNDQIAELEKELQVTKESLQATVEELETSNEELQSSNEELIASNEELQSTNEELQSVNEELYTVNSEHQSKIAELTQLNNDMNNLLRNINVGTLYLDKSLTIRKFTPLVNEITNIRNSDVGRPIQHISIENLYRNFIKDTEEVIHDLKIKEKEILGPDKNWYLIRMIPYRNDDNAVDGVVITFININSLKESQKRYDQERKLLIRILDNSPLGKTMVDKNGQITYTNKTARQILGISEKELLQRDYKDKQWKITAMDGSEIPPEELPFSKIMKTKESIFDYKHFIELSNNKKVLLKIHGAPMFASNGKVRGAVFTLENITDKEEEKTPC